MFWVKLVTDTINIGLGCILLYLGSRVFSSIRLSLQQSSIRLFLAAAVFFSGHELLSLFAEKTEFIHILHEILQTGFIGCLCLAMWFIVRSQKSEISGLHQLADTDQLTSLDNLSAFRRRAALVVKEEKDRAKELQKEAHSQLQARTQLQPHLQNEAEAIAATGSLPLAMLMMDIDEFKSYNDSFGHEAGNIALRTVAQVIRQTARQQDMVARYGGEEFVALMAIGPDSALSAAERIRLAVEAECHPQSNPFFQRQVTVSIGLATPSPDDAPPESMADEEVLNRLIKIADHELYRAKKSGRNCVMSSAVGEEERALAA